MIVIRSMSNIFAWAIDGKLDDLKHLRITDINEWNKLVNNIDNPASDEGITALHYAARYGRTEFLIFLINEMNANLYAKQINGYTVLHEASVKNQIETINVLITLDHIKTNSPCLISTKDNNGNTPIMEACFWNGKECKACETLLKLGANPEE